MKIRRIGIFGGSFNPIHTGHCVIADGFIEQCSLDVCYLIPTYHSPLKSAAPSISPFHRLEMCRIIARTHPKLKVWDGEIRRKGKSFTIDTIHWFNKNFEHIELFLLIGQDQANLFRQWKDYQEILRQVRLCVVRRGDEDLTLPDFNEVGGHHVPRVVSTPRIDVSSTAIREAVLNKQSVRYHIHDKVLRYIRRHTLYTNPVC
ncbi:MAG: nicotinate (nicotinamide) nucleotide adenylyltransferase [Candidatus Kapabacteria bacterium]|nr:nicotinate (nicotinamide) nucleotide adenylyltransferase [Candidatus Kapabacteria bacterium]